MHDPLFYKYYDAIYSGKDYSGEVESILGLYRTVVGGSPQRILDVGCGTGKHSCCFASAGHEVIGTDIDVDEIAIASRKALSLPEPRPQFYGVDIAELDQSEFDLAVSLFNVISYIHGIGALKSFLSAIRDKLKTGGLFVFDCWNGVAVITDPPQVKKSFIHTDTAEIEVETIPALDLMSQTVDVRNRVKVHLHSTHTEYFEYAYRQFLWTPAVLTDILTSCRFEVLSMNPSMRHMEQAAATTWKIMLVCRAQ
jgi:SAM-dependent methyltransferase